MAFEFSLGNRHVGRREHDYQWRDPGDGCARRPQGRHTSIIYGGLGPWNSLSIARRFWPDIGG